MDKAPENRMQAPAPDRGPEFTDGELVDELYREVAMRRRVYPSQVRQGRMSQSDADRKIRMMEAACRRLVETRRTA